MEWLSRSGGASSRGGREANGSGLSLGRAQRDGEESNSSELRIVWWAVFVTRGGAAPKVGSLLLGTL